jgi:murein DD-endopeptidase MepM/ murein hydrolase activator NlpD
MQRQGNGIPAITLIVLAMGGFGFLLLYNSRPAQELRVIVPTQLQPTIEVNAWEQILEEGFGSDSTPLPTVAIPTIQFVPPTLALQDALNSTSFPAAALSQATATPFLGATPTLPPPTAPALVTAIPVTQIYVTRPPQQWAPPPLIPPISLDLLGRDHYWLRRPIDSNANNRGILTYPYGSRGPEENMRIHAGIDLSNPIGETVRAAGDGTVVWAADGLRVQGGAFQDTFSYGNVVVIEHDFGYDNRRIFTLYAHLALVNVVQGQRVLRDDPIGLVGNTGRVTGPHVHFEVRLGDQGNYDSNYVPTYGNTYNPVLWMVPYVGTGVIAGRVIDQFGDLVNNAEVTVRSRATGQVSGVTTSYIYENTGVDVNADPRWQENFVVSDLPVGRHEVVAVVEGERVTVIVNVVEGTTTFVELSLARPPTEDAAATQES